jgi:hypothetical protein
MINDIAYEYDRYLKSAGADVAEEKDQVIDKYFKDMIKELTDIRNENKGATYIVKDLQEALENWVESWNEALDEIEDIENN